MPVAAVSFFGRLIISEWSLTAIVARAFLSLMPVLVRFSSSEIT